MGTLHAAGTNHRRYKVVVAGLWAGPWFAAPCYHCHHAIIRGLGTVQHLISPAVRPDLAWEPSNLRPAHGSGRRRCQTCGLSCQQIAAGNHAPRDPHGRPLPWDEAFIEKKVAERAARGNPPPAAWTGRKAARPPVRADVGRPW